MVGVDGQPVVVVTGANGLVGARTVGALLERGAEVRAVVRRAGSAPGGIEFVGDFTDPAFAGEVVTGADALITTVHPMLSDEPTQRQVGVEGTAALVRAAADAGVGAAVHVSTAAVYERVPGGPDVDESSRLVDDNAGAYAVTKRDLDLQLAGIEGITRVLLRPPAILGVGPTSVWNTLRPSAMRDHEGARHGVADQSFPWVHVADLAAFAADLATGRTAAGPVVGACTAVNLASTPATIRDYYQAVTGALGVDAIWDDEPAWTGRLITDRARSWGWQPTIDLEQALGELAAGLGPGSA